MFLETVGTNANPVISCLSEFRVLWVLQKNTMDWVADTANICFWVLEAGKFKIKVLAHVCAWWRHSSSFVKAIFSLELHMRGREREEALLSFWQEHWGGLHLMTSLPPKALRIPPHWGLVFRHMNSETQVLSVLHVPTPPPPFLLMHHRTSTLLL